MASIVKTGAEGVEPAAGQEATTGGGPAQRRIETLDVLRGVALFGILLMNIAGMGLPHAYGNPSNAGGAEGANLWAWIITQVGFEGTQRGIFSMLFGASVILLVSRLEASGRTDAADIYVRRNLWLIGFGMVNAFVLLWYGDILYAYGITALFVFPFRKLKPRPLFLLGVLALAIATIWGGAETWRDLAKHEAYVEASAAKEAGAKLSPDQEAAIGDWKKVEGNITAAPEEIQEEIATYREGYFPTFEHVASINSYWQSWGLYRYFFDIFGMMLIGMALFKGGLLTLERPARLYWGMVVSGYSIGLAVNIVEVNWIIDHGFSALSFVQVAPSYDLGRLAMTLGHVGALLLFVRSGALPWLRRSLAAVGQMAVTNYLTHSLVALIVFVLLGQFGQWERHQLYYLVFAVWAVQLVVSPLWLKHYRFGPVEWLWRWLTYLKRPPFRRATEAVA
jgi:uncharacterized protein